MTEDEPHIHKRSNERLRYAVDVCHKAVNDAFKIFSLGKRPYHQLFSDVCQDINAQLDTLNLLIQPLLEAAPKYDFEGVEGNGIRSVLGVVDCILKELISHLQYCTDKHNSFFFNGTNCAAKLARFCALLSRLGKLLDIATLMHQHLGGKKLFLEVSNPVGALCMREFEGMSRECFYGQLVGLHYTPAIRNVMKGICVALSSYGIGYYTDVPTLLGQSQSLLWRGSASVISGAKYWFKEEERSRKFVELTHNCASIDFTKSFWNLVDNGPLADVPRMVNKGVDIAVEIYIEGEPLYVRNKFNQMILMHPPVGKQGHAGVTVGFLSSRFRDGQVAVPATVDPDIPPPSRFPKSKRLLVHFHGGGFVAGSHVQHEAYLRGWCRELDAVVVSINYSLAPDNPFPKGLDDCIFAYAWCLENMHTLGCSGKSIVFVGDSAGGNLAISTAMRANSYGLRPPDGIVAAYPVTYVKYAGSVSRLLSTLDILLPSGVLQCCLRAYSGVPVDSNEGFCEWMQTAHQASNPDKPENRQTISELNSKYISDICSTSVPKYTIPEAANMPSLNTPSPEPETSDHISSRTGHTTSNSPITSTDNPPAALSAKNSQIKNNDEAVNEDQVVSKDEVVRKVLELSQSEEGGEVSDNVSEIEPVELDTIRINPIVFDNNRITLPNIGDSDNGTVKSEVISLNNFESNASVVNEEIAENVELSDGINNQDEEVVENTENSIAHDQQSDDKTIQSEVEPNGQDINTHSSYILLNDSNEEKQKSDSFDEDKKEETKQVPVVNESEVNGDTETKQGSDEIKENLENGALETGSLPQNDESGKADKEEVQDNSQSEGADNLNIKPGNETDNCSNKEDITVADTKNIEVESAQNGNVDNPSKVIIPKDVSNKGVEESVDDKTSLSSANSHENTLKPDDKDLERMLYDDNETRFKGAKLVLTPNKDSATATTPITPVTPSKTMKKATIVRDDEPNVYPEPAYVINPGEIATRKNATLLQKYFDDPFMSPYLADQDTLAALPPIHVVAAEYDPLLDDAIAFCRNVKEAGGTVSLEVIPGMTHGFLNLVLSSKACSAAAQKCLVAVSKMFDKGEEE
ncbi:hypothetical protein ACHWQZ_G013595 [Mnemiopsis leidyi]